MNRSNAANGELISALMDGAVTADELPAVVDAVTSTREGMVTWQAYHLVGEALRGAAQAQALDGVNFAARVRDRLAEQHAPRPLQQVEQTVPAASAAGTKHEVANDPVMRWKLLAGAASLAAVATVGWHLASLNAGAGAQAQMAAAPQVRTTVPTATAREAQAPVATAAPVMLRDTRLDELLAAHKQFGGTSALQMPAGFLRNATFDGSQR